MDELEKRVAELEAKVERLSAQMSEPCDPWPELTMKKAREQQRLQEDVEAAMYAQKASLNG